MNLNWFESILYGLFSGLTDIIPVSARAHQVLMLKVFGRSGSMDLMDLMIRLALVAALYGSCRSSLVRMNRARKLSNTPKGKRKRPLDVRSMMDMSMLRTMLIPALLGLFLLKKTAAWESNLILLALFLLVNGLVLYIPQFLPGGNRDSRTLSRVEGLLMGLGGTAAAVPGISALGALTSIGSVCGVERTYCLDMALIVNLFLNAGLALCDLLAIFDGGLGALSVLILLRYLLSALCAFGAAWGAIRLLRRLAAGEGYGPVAFYCFGLSLFIFILNLIA